MNPERVHERIARELGLSRASSPPAPLRKPRVPDHELLSKIGCGSYGEVWLAKSITGQLRAVKVVWREDFASEYPYDREFRGITRFEPISRSHPGLINILHVGRDDAADCFFYVMELGDNAMAGRPPDAEQAAGPALYAPRTFAVEIKRRRRLPTPEVLSLGVALGRALGHLHRHGLVHRDVKPSNVVFINHCAKLADIGLVAGKNEARSFVGTEGFIPPEGTGTERADIFSLGRTLYQAATGADPHDFPQLPEDLDSWTPSERQTLLELNEVLARACAAQPEVRHKNAEQFADELDLILAGRSIRKLYQREGLLRSATRLLAGALVMVALIFLAKQFERYRSAERVANQRREHLLRAQAETAKAELRQESYLASLEHARATVRSGEVGQRIQTLEAIRQAARLSNSPALRREAIAALLLPDLQLVRQIPGSARANFAELDPQFNQIAVSRGVAPVELRSAATGMLLATLPPATNLMAFAAKWSPEGRFLAISRAATADAVEVTLELWDVPREQLLLTLSHSPYQPFSFHPQHPGELLTYRDGRIVLLDVPSGRTLDSLPESGPPKYLQFSPDGRKFVELRRDGFEYFVLIRDFHGSTVASPGFGYLVGGLDWHPADRWIAVPDKLGDVYLLDTHTAERRVLGRQKSPALDVTFTPDGENLVSMGAQGEMICWSLSSMQPVLSLSSYRPHIQFGRDTNQCALLADNGLQLFQFHKPLFSREFNPESLVHLWGAAFSPDAHFFVAAGLKEMTIWDWAHSRSGLSIPNPENATPFFANDSSELFAYWNDAIGHWRLQPAPGVDPPLAATAVPVNKLRRVYSAMICSNNLILTGQGGVESVPLDRASTGPGRLFRCGAGFGCLSADGQWLALRTEWVPTIRIYRMPEMREEARLDAGADVMNFAFAPATGELALATRNGVEFLEPETWRRRGILPVRMSTRAMLIFPPRGPTVWICNDAHSGGLYNAQTFESLLPLPKDIVPMALSSDGRYLAVSLSTQRLQIWDLEKFASAFAELGIAWNSGF